MTTESIRNKIFERSFRGCDPKDVELFLDQVADEVERLQKSNQEQEFELSKLKARLSDYQNIDHSLKGMLAEIEKKSKELLYRVSIDAQRRRDMIQIERQQILKTAHQEADLITREAEHKSKVFLTNANAQLKRLHDQIHLLHAQRIALVTRIKSILLSQVDFMEALQRDADAPRLESLQYSEIDVSKKGLDAAQLEDIVKRLEEIEGTEK